MDIDVKELRERMDSGEFVLIDVREPHEREQFHLGGELIPMGEFPEAAEKLESQKEKEIVVYCRSGNRSGMIAQLLRAEGFTRVRNLEGGILAWVDEFGSDPVT